MKEKNDTIDFSTILASSVHDMKNSLAMLLGSLAEVTQQCEPNVCPVQQKLLKIHHEGQRVNRDLIQLLTLYRIGNDQYFLNVDEQMMDEFLQDIALENEEMLCSYGIRLEVECEAELSGFFDHELVSGVINTVIHNAYQYTRDTIRLSIRQTGDYRLITVEDNGLGYPAHMLSTAPPQGGVSFTRGSTGLGLYFAAQVARLHESRGHRGYTRISNTGIDQGGCFSLYLP